MKLLNLAVAGAGLIVFGLSACDRTDTPAAEGAPKVDADRPLEPSVVLYRAADCVVGANGAPKEGQTFTYRMLRPDGQIDPQASIQRTVRSISGDQIDYSEALTMAGMGAMPPETRQVRLAILPTRHMMNTVRYEDAAAVVAGLQPGQSAVIPMSETTGPSPGRSSQGEANVTFVGCGVSEPVVSGAPSEPVRVFRVRLPYSNADAPGELTQLIDTEFVVSQTNGWPIAERQRNGVIVLVSASE